MPKDMDKLTTEAYEFNLALSKEYTAMAQKESRLYSQAIETKHFLQKGRDAKEGKEVLPDTPPKGLTATRDRLLFAINRGGKYIEPTLAARTQVFFDCMVEESKVQRGMEDMMVCKKGFIESLQDLETAVFKNAPIRNVSFEEQSEALSNEGLQIIKEIAARVKKFRDRRIMVVGHGNSAHLGKDPYTQALAVKNALIHEGVAAGDIKIIVNHGNNVDRKAIDDSYNHVVSIYLF